MQFEQKNSGSIPKIGFGCWSIGGGMSANPALDQKSLLALRSALDLGYTHFDTAEAYASGHCEELLGQVIKNVGMNRKALFITTKVSPEHLTPEYIQLSCERSLSRLGLDYIDLYLIHWPRIGMNLKAAFQSLNALKRAGKVRHLGVSNFNLKLLKQAQSYSESAIFSDQVPYSLNDRRYANNGVLDYCQKNDILLTAYSPLDQGNFKYGKKVQEIAQAHGVTPEQVALGWLVAQSKVITIPMSFDPQHQRENLAAADLVLSAAEFTQLSSLHS